jgi:hypothetical protein
MIFINEAILNDEYIIDLRRERIVYTGLDVADIVYNV